jgi:hypothetical protein
MLPCVFGLSDQKRKIYGKSKGKGTKETPALRLTFHMNFVLTPPAGILDTLSNASDDILSINMGNSSMDVRPVLFSTNMCNPTRHRSYRTRPQSEINTDSGVWHCITYDLISKRSPVCICRKQSPLYWKPRWPRSWPGRCPPVPFLCYSFARAYLSTDPFLNSERRCQSYFETAANERVL